MASEMMKNMKPEDMQNMMRTFQENPQMMEQARRMMGGNQFGGPGAYPPPPPPSAPERSPLDSINTLKKAGNDFIQHKDYEKAGVKYLEAILDIETLRGQLTPAQMANQRFLGELNDLEIGCRNNYCIAKTNLGEFGLILPHAERVLAIDHKNPKALYNVSLAQFNLREFQKAHEGMEKLSAILGPGNLGSKIEELRTKINEKLAPVESKTDGASGSEGSKTEGKTETKASTSPSPDTPREEKKAPSPPTPPTSAQPQAPTFTKEEPQTPKNVFDVPPTHSPASPERPPVHDDFRFDDEDQSEKLEALFQKHKKEARPVQKETPTAPSPSHPSPQPFQPGTAASDLPSAGLQGLLNRYWQIVLGILIGLLIAKLLR